METNREIQANGLEIIVKNHVDNTYLLVDVIVSDEKKFLRLKLTECDISKQRY